MIKEIAEKEIASSAEIVRRSFQTVAQEFGLTKENAPTNGAFLEDSTLLGEYRNGVKMFGLFEGGKQIGFVALEQKDGDTFYLEKLAIMPECRHKARGKALVRHAVEYVRNKGGKTISIGIIHENKQLLEWYKTLGFEETGTKEYPHLPFTVCFMSLSAG